MIIPIANESKVFCMAPWVHMHVWPNGSTYACCLHPPEVKENALGNIKTEGLVQVWNGTNMRKLRTNMLNEIPTPEVCTRCYQKEDGGFSSLRKWMNEYFYERHLPVVESTTDDGTVDKFNLVHWDFRFSNLCNLKCRTCGHELSSQWYDDFVKEHPRHKVNPKVIRIVERNDPDFWALLESIIPEVETIHFAGGEPLIRHWNYCTNISGMISRSITAPMVLS
jgi:radical SAM protein with 4Fe4S-binding SPASM domain